MMPVRTEPLIDPKNRFRVDAVGRAEVAKKRKPCIDLSPAFSVRKMGEKHVA